MAKLPYNQLNKGYNFYKAGVVGIINRCGLDVHHRNKLNKTKYYTVHYFDINSHLKQLYISNRTECFSYKGGVAYMYIDVFKRRAGLIALGYYQLYH